MSTLRSRTIRLAHVNPELRPHLLPLLTKSAGNMEEALLEKMADGARADFEAVQSHLDGMKFLLTWVQNANPTAKKQFDSLYGKILKAGIELVKSANKLLDYTDTFGPQGENEDDFVAVRRLLSISIKDWQENLRQAMAGAGALAAGKLVEAQMAGGYAMRIAKNIRGLVKVLEFGDTSEVGY